MTNAPAVARLLDAVRIERLAINRADLLHSREHAPRFNLVESLSPGETRLSSVFRWMLDEGGSHGQRDAFRRLFFERFPQVDIDGAIWTDATVRCEVPTANGRRIDLLMETTDRRYALVIENKPWAAWQERQLEDYWRDRRCGNRPVRAKVLALVGGVDNAQAHVEAEWRRYSPDFCGETILGVEFGAVAEWVSRCAESARPPKVGIFLHDLADFLRTHASGKENSMTETIAIADLVLKGGAEQINAAFGIAAAIPAIYEGMRDKVAAEAGGEWIPLDGYNVLRVIEGGVGFDFAFFNKPYHDLWVGVAREFEKDKLTDRVTWRPADRTWSSWLRLDEAGASGSRLAESIANADLAKIGNDVRATARELLRATSPG